MTIIRENRLTDEELMTSLIYRDGLILALNKPAGIAVHAAGPCKHNLEQYFYLLQFGLKDPPVLAHRLDRGTSGCLVLARNKEGARRMQRLFTQSLIEKTYLALLEGQVIKDSGRIDIPFSKIIKPKNSRRMVADNNGTISAITDFFVLKRFADKTLVKLKPHTGRTHQLRVHCMAMGHPIIGDEVYGSDTNEQLHLHARNIKIPLYDKKPAIDITAPLPEHMKDYMIYCTGP